MQSGSPTTLCNFACDETTEFTKVGQTRAVSGVVECADLSPRGCCCCSTCGNAAFVAINQNFTALCTIVLSRIDKVSVATALD